MSKKKKMPDMVKGTGDIMSHTSKTVKIGDLLTKEQIDHVMKTMEVPNFHYPLTKYLESIEPRLESKGMLPGFFAYWLEWARMEGRI